MTKVKICGITNLEDALAAVEAGADLLGFIFYEPSPRYVPPEVVREIVAGVKGQVAGGRWQVTGGRWQVTGRRLQVAGCRWQVTGRRWQVAGGRWQVAGGRWQVASVHNSQFTIHNSQFTTPTFVGVFVNASLATVARILDEGRLDAAQLHGDEPPEFVNQLQGRAYKAIRPQSLAEAETLIQQYPPCSPSPLLPCFLLDAYHPNLYGGTGHVTDWSMAAALARRYPLMLAGSLTPANVAQAIGVVKPWGVDVSSGVERAKGQKDHEQVRAFVAVVKKLVSKT